jgi:hypothetical protein
VVIPPESSILAGVQADINAAFGGGLNPALETPQGQLASSQAAVIADKNSEIALIVNQVDPLYASGRFQDAIGRIYFLDRKAATSTAVTATLGGLVGTVVPAGTFAQDLSGNTYILLGSVAIGAGGTVSSSWQNIATGPIPCPAATLTKVYQAVPGWDTITNPADGTLGQDVETRAEFEFRRQNSVALNSRGTCPSIYGNVFEKVLGALDCYVIDNPSGLTVLTGPTNYPMLPHSVFVAVIGGADVDIAQAIWEKKDVGCDYNGNTSVTVLDNSGYSFPQPSYPVKFERPAPLAIKFAVRIVNLPSLPADIATLIRNSIVAQFNGTNGSVRARIGAAILAANYYASVALSASNVQLISVLVGTATPTDTQVDVGIDQAPTLDPLDIAVILV